MTINGGLSPGNCFLIHFRYGAVENFKGKTIDWLNNWKIMRKYYITLLRMSILGHTGDISGLGYLMDT